MSLFGLHALLGTFQAVSKKLKTLFKKFNLIHEVEIMQNIHLNELTDGKIFVSWKIIVLGFSFISSNAPY